MVPLVFYLPQGTPQEYLDEILAHGGQITNIVECFTIMLSLIPAKHLYDDGYSKEKQELPSMQHYFAGKVYSYDWIAESIRMGRIIPQEPFELVSFPYPDHQDQNMIKK